VVILGGDGLSSRMTVPGYFTGYRKVVLDRHRDPCKREVGEIRASREGGCLRHHLPVADRLERPHALVERSDSLEVLAGDIHG
jgi:hypothetical protein